jgi:hypothetical protein
MNTRRFGGTFLLLFAHTVAAQVTPKLEVFGGYSFMRLSTRSDPAMDAADVNGWNASIKLNLSSRIGLLADFGGHYGRRGFRPLPLITGGIISERPGAPFIGASPAQAAPQIVLEPGNINQHTFLFGPEIRIFRSDRLTANIHGLAGMAHTSGSVFPLREPYQPPPDLLGNVPPPITKLSYGSMGWFAASVGGNLDYRITDRLSYRIIQPELVVTFTNSFESIRAYRNLRLSTGVVFTFGKR